MSLIHSYGLLSSLKVLPARPATEEELESFHSHDYLAHCRKASSNLSDPATLSAGDDSYEIDDDDDDEDTTTFGLAYDCPPLPDMTSLLAWIAGGSLAAAEALTSGLCRRAINWGGGWHHSQRDEASGFCYVNDIVLAIHALRKTFERVLYIDLDIHHGDGVENAFAFTNKVLTFSIHNGEVGFFPGTGKLRDVGLGKGRYHALNVPLKEGVNDSQYHHVFTSLFDSICDAFSPDAIVVQCGADCLAQDPLGGFNLSLRGTKTCVENILKRDLPTLFLGGGGYHGPNAAKYWTYLTSIIARQQAGDLPVDIPDQDRFFTRYGPSFELAINRGRRPNRNTDQELNFLIRAVQDHIQQIGNSVKTEH